MIQLARISAVYAAIFAIIAIVLALRVVLARRRVRAGMGDGDDAQLARAIRVHGNCMEYVPMALLLMVVFELNGGSQFFVHFLGSSLLVARILHAWGLSGSGGISFGRFYGTAVTWFVIVFAAAANLQLAIALG